MPGNGYYFDELGRLTNLPRPKPKRTSSDSSPMVLGEVDPEIRALSIRQPWAEQILRGEKQIEYRTVACTNMIGKRIYLYASARRDKGELEECQRMSVKHSDLPTGVIVGTMEIDWCGGRKGNYQWWVKTPHRFNDPIKPVTNRSLCGFGLSAEEKQSNDHIQKRGLSNGNRWNNLHYSVEARETARNKCLEES